MTKAESVVLCAIGVFVVLVWAWGVWRSERGSPNDDPTEPWH